MNTTSITKYHQLLDMGMNVPDSLMTLIGKEHGVDAESAARTWYAQVEKTRQQE